MSEDITNSPTSDKMDETSDQSTPTQDIQNIQDYEINVAVVELDNEHNKQQSPQTPASITTTTTTTTTKTVSKSIVTNSHPLMYSPDSDTDNIDNFNPAAHSSLTKSYESNLMLDLELDLDLDIPNIETYNEQLPAFPESPTAMKKSLMYEMPLEIQPGNGGGGAGGAGTDQSDTENEKSIYEAILSPNLQNVSLTMNEKYGNLNFLSQVKKSNKLRKIKVVPPETQTDNSDVSSIDSVSDSIKSEDVYPDKQNIDIDMSLIRELLDSPDLDDSVLEAPDFSPKRETPPQVDVDPIEEYTAEEERRDSRHWQKIVLPSGEQRNIDMRVIEPYKRVLSHGGYLKAGGHNAIIIFSACYLPDKSRKDYVYVMDNLFLYVLQTLDQLVTEDYVLIYLHGSASSHCIPTMGWLKRCYQLIDRRLRKNLKQLYLVHPTFWLKTIIMMTKPFISAKFYRKLHFVNSLQELTNRLPIEQAAIPERVINYDKLKFSTS